MGLLDSIKSIFVGANAKRTTSRVCIVDAEKLADPRDGRVGPVERFRTIQQLSRFAEREQLQLVAVVGGRPLREVADGETYNGVRVYYVEEGKTLADRIEKTLEQIGARNAFVITNDRQLEARLRDRGVPTMRLATLKKGLEASEATASESDNARAERERDRERRNRRSSRAERPQEPTDEAAKTADAAPGESSASPASPAEPAPQTAAQKPQDTIDGLIDRVN